MYPEWEKDYFMDDDGRLAARYRLITPIVVCGVEDVAKSCCGACAEEKVMSEDYAEYDHENIQMEPLRIIQQYTVTSIEIMKSFTVGETEHAEVTLMEKGSTQGFLSMSLPVIVGAAFHLGQKFTMMLTEVNDLGVKE